MRNSALPSHVLLQTPNGYRNIKDLRVNAQVLAWNTETLKEEYVTILTHEKHELSPFWNIKTLNGNKLSIGETQRVFTHDKDFVTIGSLSEGDVVLIANGDIDTICSINSSIANEEYNTELYSITTTAYNNVFANRILVHI